MIYKESNNISVDGSHHLHLDVLLGESVTLGGKSGSSSDLLVAGGLSESTSTLSSVVDTLLDLTLVGIVELTSLLGTSLDGTSGLRSSTLDLVPETEVHEVGVAVDKSVLETETVVGIGEVEVLSEVIDGVLHVVVVLVATEVVEVVEIKLVLIVEIIGERVEEVEIVVLEAGVERHVIGELSGLGVEFVVTEVGSGDEVLRGEHLKGN